MQHYSYNGARQYAYTTIRDRSEYQVVTFYVIC